MAAITTYLQEGGASRQRFVCAVTCIVWEEVTSHPIVLSQCTVALTVNLKWIIELPVITLCFLVTCIVWEECTQ